MTETERMYAYFICSIPMIGGVRAGQLLSRFGDPQGVYEAGTAGWREILSDSVVEYMDRQKKSGNLYYRFKASMLIKNQKSVIHHTIQLSGKSRSADTEKACQLMALQQDIGMLLHIFHDFFTQAVLH